MSNIYKSMTLDTNMNYCIAFLEEILVTTKANTPGCTFSILLYAALIRHYVREAYKYGTVALFHLKDMGHMILKLFELSDITVQVQGPAQEIKPLK